MDLKTQLTTLFNDLKEIAQVAAPIMAFIGIIGAGVIYTGSGLPLIGRLKQEKPDLMNSLAIGMGLLIAASSLMGMIAFS
jgi:hypothetical protein